jgi:hypothetical protein
MLFMGTMIYRKSWKKKKWKRLKAKNVCGLLSRIYIIGVSCSIFQKKEKKKEKEKREGVGLVVLKNLLRHPKRQNLHRFSHFWLTEFSTF